MTYLQTLYASIAVGVAAAVAVVVIDSAAADVVAGLIVLIALAVVTRAVIQLAADGEEAPRWRS
jgi:hypothetical protein